MSAQQSRGPDRGASRTSGNRRQKKLPPLAAEARRNNRIAVYLDDADYAVLIQAAAATGRKELAVVLRVAAMAWLRTGGTTDQARVTFYSDTCATQLALTHLAANLQKRLHSRWPQGRHVSDLLQRVDRLTIELRRLRLAFLGVATETLKEEATQAE
jgi:hypothetical protein